MSLIEPIPTLPLIDALSMTDVFVEGVHSIEIIGPNARVIYFVTRKENGEMFRIGASSIVMPKVALFESRPMVTVALSGHCMGH